MTNHHIQKNNSESGSFKTTLVDISAALRLGKLYIEKSKNGFLKNTDNIWFPIDRYGEETILSKKNIYKKYNCSKKKKFLF